MKVASAVHGEAARAADEPEMRLFFALTADAVLRATLHTAATALPLAGTARRVSPESYHLTVAFVGAVPASQLAAVQRVGASQRAVRCVLTLSVYEYWPKPEVVVAAAAVIPAPLEGLWQGLHRDLEPLCLARAPKRLRPHVTLARRVALEPKLPALRACPWPATSFSLMRSDLRDGEPLYTVVDTWPLLDEE